ncbi:zinc ribbon domain-containing protein [Desulfatirhabdium butyrativorans]|uniref:zinc ribbon domain-containing protein n=1 Tax=Desulfatirhabdium butyrativorans TaxID=340467 RepID=UPI00068689DC|nr:zinc ribbon domain-containing protein [Desulfatirhabdium butyrativorans]
MIIDFAEKTGCRIIQMKDPSTLRPPKDGGTDSYLCAMLADWAVCDLMEKIKFKAGEKGITVKEVNPQYTSLRCFKCGHISENNRPEWHHFLCENCGYDTHADHNASQNLTVIGIDEMIAEQCASGNVMTKTHNSLEKELA